jgi:DNA-binding CsgD family transcriptional regulator/PAS domain-containing protein
MSFNQRRLLQCIMEGPLENPPWQSLAREMRHSFQASHVDLLFQRPRSHAMDFVEVLDFESRPADLVEQYRLHYMATEPLPYFSMQAGKAYTLTDLIGDRENNEFYRNFLQPAGLDHLIMLYVEEPGGFRCWVSAARREDMGPFTSQEVANCEWLVDHMQTAMRLYAALKKLELERDIYASALSNLHMGYLLLDQRGHVIRMDEEAERLLARNPDLYLGGEMLRIRQADKNEELQQIIAEGLASPKDFSRGLNVPGSHNLGLLIKSAPDSPLLASTVTPHLVIYINDPAAPKSAPKARIAELFELSPTEAALVAELVHGRTLAEAAANINITEQTARSYSKRIFSKTGTRRQAELVRLILTSVALVA